MAAPKDICESSEFTQKRNAIIETRQFDELTRELALIMASHPEVFPIVEGNIRIVNVIKSAFSSAFKIFFYETEKTIELVDIVEIEESPF